MNNPEIEEFARTLVQQVRDAAIRSSDQLLRPEAASPAAQRWRNAGAGSLAAVVIPDAIDETVFRLLHAIDEGILHLKFVAASGREVDLSEDGMGELAGWYMGSGGWRAMHSKERWIDDFADMNK